MEFISTNRYVPPRAQVRAVAQPFQMAPARVSISVLLLNESLQGLGQQPRNRGLPPYCDQLYF